MAAGELAGLDSRASFSQEMRAHGIEGLIERLTARNTPAMEKLTAARAVAVYHREAGRMDGIGDESQPESVVTDANT